MISLPPSVKIFVCLSPVDMRRSFDGLSAMARHVLEQDPMSGHLFVFLSKRADRVKILWWDRDGWALWCKRLERGTFRAPTGSGASVQVGAADLALLLEGIDPASARRGKRLSIMPC
jgi:transposase